MRNTPPQSNVYLHPTICSRRQHADQFQRSTGLQLVISSNGVVRAVPTQGAA